MPSLERKVGNAKVHAQQKAHDLDSARQACRDVGMSHEEIALLERSAPAPDALDAPNERLSPANVYADGLQAATGLEHSVEQSAAQLKRLEEILQVGMVQKVINEVQLISDKFGKLVEHPNIGEAIFFQRLREYTDQTRDLVGRCKLDPGLKLRNQQTTPRLSKFDCEKDTQCFQLEPLFV